MGREGKGTKGGTGGGGWYEREGDGQEGRAERVEGGRVGRNFPP